MTLDIFYAGIIEKGLIFCVKNSAVLPNILTPGTQSISLKYRHTRDTSTNIDLIEMME